MSGSRNTTAGGDMLDAARPVTAYIRHLHADRDDPACRSRYIRVIIHPDATQLVAAGTAHSRKHGSKQDLTESAGLFQPAPFRSRYDRKTRQWVDSTPAFAGVMRLARGWLTSEIIAHESTHAALHIWRLHDWAQPDGQGNVDLGDGCGPREEAFAHLLGGIAGAVANIVWRYQHTAR